MSLQHRSLYPENHPLARDFLNDQFVLHPGQFAFFPSPLTEVNPLWNGGASVHCRTRMESPLGLQSGVESRKDDRGDQNYFQTNRQKLSRRGLFLFTLFLLLSSLLIVPARAATDCAVQTDISQIECEALLALYNSTNGASWTNNSGWNVDNQPCSWYGVLCILGSVRFIELNDNNLVGILPKELSNLWLGSISLNGNQLSGSLPPEWSNLIGLSYLNLSANQLTGPLPPEWGNMTALRQLFLSDNQLSGSLPPEWSKLSVLEWLSLRANQLTGTLPPEWGNLSALDDIDLYMNKLSGPLPPEWNKLSMLRRLLLYSNQLSGPLPPEWGNLTALEYLDLNSNQLNGHLPQEWSSLDALQALNLHNNQLSGSLPAEWSKLSNLQSLVLSINRLSGTLPPEWSNLSTLADLSLDDNQLSGSLPPEWSNLSALKWLGLSSNQLSGIFPPEWGNLSALQVLHLSNNQLSGNIPPDFTHLTQLENAFLPEFIIRYNMFTTDDPTVATFINNYDSSWQNYQTIPPKDLTATANNDQVQLNWTPILYQEDAGYYEVGYSHSSGGPYTIMQVRGDKTVSTHTVTHLLSATPYYFVVRTHTSVSTKYVKNVWTSPWSMEIQATTLSDLPSLMVNVPTLTRPYGTPNPTLLPTYTGWIGSTETIDTPPILTTEATETSPPGTYSIICSGGQDDNYLIVCGFPGTLTVTLADTTTTLTPPTPNPSVSGNEVTFNFAVQPTHSTPEIPTGEVEIRQNTLLVCQAPLTNGLGTCTAPLTGMGSQTFTATYLGNEAFQGSTSEAISHFLLQAGYVSTPVPGETLNLGSTSLNTLVTASLKIEETGTQSLQVALQSLIGDSDFKILTPLPMNIANGDPESVITLTCTPTSPGTHTATLALSTNDPAQPTVSYPLTCEGQAPPGYESSPPSDIILKIGNSQVGQSITFPLNVKEVGTGDLQVNFVDLTGPQASDFQVLSPTFPFTIKDEAGTPQLIEIRCTPSDLGQREAHLTLTSNDPQHPTLTYPLTCQGTAIPTAGYASLPDHNTFINVGTSRLGQPVSFTLDLIETGNLPLTVTFKDISGPQAQDFSILSPSFPLTLPDDAPSQAVILQCVPSAPGLRMAELAFTSNDPHHPFITYSLQCIGQGEIAYHSEPPPNSTINFGTLPLGKAQTISLSVNKIGKRTLDIVKAEFTNASYFSLLNWKLPLSLQDTAQSLPIQCLPGEPGKHQTSLVVTLSDLSKVSYSLLCYGFSEKTEITQIGLSNQIVAAHTRVGEVIGNFHSEVTGVADPHFLYRLIEDAQGIFKVLKDQLILAKPLTFEEAAIYQIIVKSMEENSGAEKNASFVLEVNVENRPPTKIQLSRAMVGERSQGLVGILTTLDPDKNDTHTYTLASGGQFVLKNGNEVHVAPDIVFKKQSNYLIRVTSTDAGGLKVSQEFPIKIQAEARFTGEIRDKAGKIRKDGKIDEPERVTLMGRIQPSAFHVGQLADLMFFYHWTPVDGGRALEGSVVFAPQTRLEENMAERRFFQGFLLGLAGVFKIELGYRIGENVWSESLPDLEVLKNRPPTKLELTMKPVLEKSPENTLIGTFRMDDPDRSEYFHYRLMDESKWQGYLVVQENQLLTGPWPLRWGKPYVVTIRGMDSSGASLEKTVTLEVLKDDSIGELRLTHAEVIERSSAGTPIGRLFILGEKEGNTYHLLDDAQGRFDLKEDILVVKAGEKLDSKVQSHHEIVAEVVRGSQRREKAFLIEVLRDHRLNAD